MIYLDFNATAPLRPGVLEAMQPYLTELTGNPSSVHAAGRSARQGLETARRRVAALLEVHDSRIVFTSGGTESNNAALFGVAARRGFQGRLIVSAVEHPSVLEAARILQRRGMGLTIAPVDASGRVDPGWILDAIDDPAGEKVVLVSVMHANNETGVIQPVEEIGAGCRQRGVPLHVDAVQSVTKIPVRLEKIPADLLSLSAHKFGGPKGIGALAVDKRMRLEPFVVGGGQERNRRSGTQNVPGAVGFGAAVQAAAESMDDEAARLSALRDGMEQRLGERLPDAIVLGHDAPRLPNTSQVGVAGLDGEALVMNMDLAGFAISGGSACSSGKVSVSHVLAAMGVEPVLGRSAVRVSLGWRSSADEVERFVNAFVQAVDRLKAMSGPLALTG